MRMSEYLVAGREGGDRHPFHTNDIEPMMDGVRREWGPRVNGVCIYISGSRTDWLNQGPTRSHRKVGEDSPDKYLCAAAAVLALFGAYPAKFQNSRGAPFATWCNCVAIPANHATSILRAAALKQGHDSSAYPCAHYVIRKVA